MPVLLPPTPTAEELLEIKDYLDFHSKIREEEQGLYQDREEIRQGLIIFKHQKKKLKNWYMRMYVGNRKYKITSLKTQNYRSAKELAFDEYDRLNQHIKEKGDVFEKTNDEYLQDYVQHLENELDKNNDIIIIPGVGSFKQGMNVLKKNGLAEKIKEHSIIKKKKISWHLFRHAIII